MKALIIDDDEIARELLVSTLERAGVEVFALPSPIGATKMLMNHHIDGVVLDVMMPELNGDKLAKLLRNNSRLRKLGVVLVSSIDPQELEQLRLRSTAHAVVQKSRIRTDLPRVLRHAVATARAGVEKAVS